MKALLIEIGEVPQNLLLFGWLAQRLSIANFTWAPTSLSNVLWPGNPEETAACTEEGLFGTFTVVNFPDAKQQPLCGMVSTAMDTGSRERRGDEGPQLGIGVDGVGFFVLFLSPRVTWEPTYSGFLSNCSASEMKSGHEYAVAVVHVLSDSNPSGHSDVLRCKYVGPGQVVWIEPAKAVEARLSRVAVKAAISRGATNVV